MYKNYLPEIINKLKSYLKFLVWGSAAMVFLMGGCVQTSEVLDVSNRKQVFVDEALFESSQSVSLTMNQPFQDEKLLITVDQDWERKAEGRIHAAYASVLQEKGMIRIWYTLHTNDPAQMLCVCYAESKDGIHFVKPKLGLYELNGSKENNIVIPGTVGGSAVWIDPKAPAEHRYKTQARTYFPKDRKFLMHSSPDGIHWSLFAELDVDPNDTQNIIFWDETVGRYVLYGREMEPYVLEPKKQVYRQVRRLESDDLLTWDNPDIVMDADAMDLATYKSATKQPSVDYYGGVVFRYPDAQGVYIMLAHPYWHWKKRTKRELRNIYGDVKEKKKERLSPGTIDVRLATSRDGKHFFHTQERRAFLELGQEASGFSRMIWAAANPVRRGNELWIYYTGKNSDHEGFLDPVSDEHRGGIGRAVIRLDGFISVDAGIEGGEFTTRPIQFSGNRLYLNLNASGGGSAQVELLDEQGKAIMGYSAEDSEVLYGNSVQMLVSWANGADVSQLAGKAIRMRVILKSAKLYAFEFRKTSCTVGKNQSITGGDKIVFNEIVEVRGRK